MPGLGLLRIMPFIGIAVLVYLLGAMVFRVPLSVGIFSFTLPSGAQLKFLFSDLIMILGLVLFFVELLLAASPTKTSLLNHALSMALFVVCGLLFLLAESCGTTTFLFLTALTMVDVISGYSISIIAARRDLTVERDNSA
jgi:hypothetical protein